MSVTVRLLLLVGAIASYVLYIVFCRLRVKKHVRDHYGPVTGLSVRWTVGGPRLPTAKRVKFLVRFKDENGADRSLYAVTSLFGEVYVPE